MILIVNTSSDTSITEELKRNFEEKHIEAESTPPSSSQTPKLPAAKAIKYRGGWNAHVFATPASVISQCPSFCPTDTLKNLADVVSSSVGCTMPHMSVGESPSRPQIV